MRVSCEDFAVIMSLLCIFEYQLPISFVNRKFSLRKTLRAASEFVGWNVGYFEFIREKRGLEESWLYF
jgi:hypothetical protein